MGSFLTVVLPGKPSSITRYSSPSLFLSTPGQRTSSGNRSPVSGSDPQVFESPKQSIVFIRSPPTRKIHSSLLACPTGRVNRSPKELCTKESYPCPSCTLLDRDNYAG